MKNILIIAKVMSYLLDFHLGDHKKNFFEKKTTYVLNLIEKSIEVLEEKPNVVDLIEISSLFIPHLNTPDFLFRKVKTCFSSIIR